MSKSPTLLRIPKAPEPRTVTVAMRVTESVNNALEEAARESGHTKSMVAGLIVETYLKETGYLKEPKK